MSRERINEAFDKDICYYCGDSMKDYTGARNCLLNAHWTCHEEAELETRANLRRVDRAVKNACTLLHNLETSIKKKPR